MKKILFLLLTLTLSPTILMAEEYSEGIEYTQYEKPFPVSTGDKIEVKEIFWYGCPHCFNLEAPLNKWLKEGIPANAKFIRMPGIFRDNWLVHARAYYAFESLGQTEKLHHALMDVIHVKKQRLATEDQIADFVSTQGIDRKEFIDAYNSFSVDALSRQAKIMTGKYKITGVPSIVVDGRYLVTTTTAGGKEELFKVVNYLVQQATEARQNEKVKVTNIDDK
ncbi:thiol:disulfide interchange protein DsbA precursor [bacterium BMS3Bbin11]|nr:thiol:disulfide interchange protein DsbA precursor [bacterium BMS3Abin11]GBE45261.1 thiol:disulfide interchange protein DsbA precursor [bacterium BMS3Bbin11]